MAEVKWIKITTDIFDDEKILLIESMPDADAMIVIWFKLLCLAGKQNNSGVFTMNDKIAYTEEMLATIFRRPLNTVRLALNTFESFGMIDLIDGVITIPKWDKHQSLDAYEKHKEADRIYQKEKRARQKALALASKQSTDASTDASTDIDALDKKKIRIEEDKNRKDNKRTAPVVYFPEDPNLEEAMQSFIKMRKQIKAPMTDHAIDLAIKKLDELAGNDADMKIQILNQSIVNSYRGLFPLKNQKQQKNESIVDMWMNS